MVGSPIRHSLSPALHNAAYEALSLSWRYEAIEVRAGELANFVGGLAADWVGLSVTMPLKVEALHLADEVDPVAARVGAANTLVRAADRWQAHNTDVHGMQRVLREQRLDGVASATVIGAGATARSVLAALDGQITDVTVVTRNPPRAEAVRSLDISARLRVVRLDDVDSLAEGLAAPLVINTTPTRAIDGLAAAVAAMLAGHALGAWVDVTYDPWPTAVAAVWRRRGGAVIGGLELLLAQAYRQVELMTQQRAPESRMRAAGEKALATRTH